MYDDLPEEVGVFDFDEFANHLLDQGLLASPSQLHGCLCGLLGAGAPAQPEYGLDALAQTLDLEVHGELAGRIMQLYTVTEAALQDEEFTFLPLLPDEEEEIALRTAALANWCDGFLAGFAYATAAANSNGSALSQETGEILRDIGAMAQAEPAADESEEEAEDSYIELVEYLRVAVVNVFMDSQATAGDRNMASATERPLH
jgi:yecA family protein